MESKRSRQLVVAVMLLYAAVGMADAARAQDDADSVLISLSADRMPVTEVLQLLAERSGLNIVSSDQAQGRSISVHLRQTPFPEALNLIIRSAGLSFERVGNSILVAAPEELSVETGLVTRVYDLQYADADDVAGMLSVISDDVVANDNNDRVVVKSTLSGIEETTRVVAELDRKPVQVLIESRLIEVKISSLKEIGIDWEQITKLSTVFVEGETEPGPAGVAPNELAYVPFEENGDIFRQHMAFEVALDALITDGNARLLSNTKVLTVDGEAAEIFAGETIPVVITSLQSSTAGGGSAYQSVQLEEIDVGVSLKITPRVGDDGTITTLVEPEVSRITGFVGPDDDLPATSSRKAKTLVRIADGQKIYLGGLITEETLSTVKKVPLLGSIPVLGYLFRYTREEIIRLDLVIELTPHIIDADSFMPVTQIEEVVFEEER